MRVGLVCPYDIGSPGGVQQIVTELASRLRSAGDDVVLVAAGREASWTAPEDGIETTAAGRPTVVRANRSRVPMTLGPSAWGRVRQALRDVDVINVHEPLIPLVGWAALSKEGPLVATFHANAPVWARRAYRWAPLLGTRMRGATLTAVSSTAAAVIPAHWGPVSIVPNALDVASYDLPVTRTSGRVAFLGRDDPRKGLDILLEAWPRVQRSRPEAELIVMGADRGVPPPGVTYLGPVTGDEKKRVLASSVVFVAPNTGGESFGMVVAEGMAAGCAVLASGLDAFTAVLGDAGCTFPVGDSVALADEITRLLGDPRECQRLGSAARDGVKRFDWSRVAREYRSIYAEAVY